MKNFKMLFFTSIIFFSSTLLLSMVSCSSNSNSKKTTDSSAMNSNSKNQPIENPTEDSSKDSSSQDFKLPHATFFQCYNAQGFQLRIQIFQIKGEWNVDWVLISAEKVEVSGSHGTGLFQKESDSEDAFSSFQNELAISYKNRKAAFVVGNNAWLFQCEKNSSPLNFTGL